MPFGTVDFNTEYHFGISFPSRTSLAGIRSTLISFGEMKRRRVLKVHFYFHCRGSHPPVVVALLTQAVTSHHETAANVLYRHLHKYIEAAFKLASLNFRTARFRIIPRNFRTVTHFEIDVNYIFEWNVKEINFLPSAASSACHFYFAVYE